jgi:uncharacterized protein YjaG (DUF416 family)
MTVINLTKQQLIRELNSLPKQLRIAFAAACSQRQLPSYVRFSTATKTGNAQAAEQMLTDIWNNLEHNIPASETTKKDLDYCMSLIPDYDSYYFEGQENAEDAIASVAYTLRTELGGDSQDAACAARRAYDSLVHHITARDDLDWNVPTHRSRLVSDPLVQAEFRRQRADMADLQAATKQKIYAAEVIVRIRRRAEEESAFFFGPAPLF